MICLLCQARFDPKPTWRRLFFLEYEASACMRCMEKFERFEGQIDFQDFQGTSYDGALDSASALYTYNNPMKEYLHQYKFLQDAALHTVFTGELKDWLSKNQNVLVPIPMHPDKQKIRTFSHIELLLDGIAYYSLLSKLEAGGQGRKSRSERLHATPLFQATGTVESRDYLLFDDIYTTGTTLHHAAKALKDAGARKVHALTLIKG